MKAYTKIVLDMNSGLILSREVDSAFGLPIEWDESEFAQLGGAPSGQTALADSQTSYYNNLTQEQSTMFSQDQALFKSLQAEFLPIFNKGPNQMGFSDAELATLNAQSTTGAGQAYKAESAALGGKIGAEGGGNINVKQGANDELHQQLAVSAGDLTAQELTQIQEAGYNQGYNQWLAAASGLSQASAVMNPSTAAAGAATGAGSAASSTWTNIAAENNSWMNLVSAGLGAVGTAVGGYAEGKCWIAAKIYNKSMNDPMINLIRGWIFDKWPERSYVGGLVAKLYGRYGQQIATKIPRRILMLLRPLFDAALVNAIHEVANA